MNRTSAGIVALVLAAAGALGNIIDALIRALNG